MVSQQQEFLKIGFKMISQTIHLQGFPVRGIPLTIAKIMDSIKMVKVSLMGLLNFFLQIQLLAIELLGLQKPVMQKPLQLWIFVGQDISKATDIKQFTYTLIQAQKSLSTMTSKPSGADRGHTFISQNHCHTKKQNLFTRANTALPPLGNRCTQVQLGVQALLPSCGL